MLMKLPCPRWQQLLVRALGYLAVAIALFVVLLLNREYLDKGMAECKAEGSSTLWCASTIRWQSFKAAVLK